MTDVEALGDVNGGIVKADGLALGKGVVVAATVEEAKQAAVWVYDMVKRICEESEA